MYSKISPVLIALGLFIGACNAPLGEPPEGEIPSNTESPKADGPSGPELHQREGVFDPAGDADDDGILNGEDNCVDVANADQADADADGYGDACDNCGDVANSDQDASACASDDGDATPDSYDNCLGLDNDQTDMDRDGVGDACDSCALVANAGDDAGAACTDSDADGVFDEIDNCPDVSNADQADRDNDSVGDACDNCGHVANLDQADGDDDGIGDVCNQGGDDDAVADEIDNCPAHANPDQSDYDNDGVGDACDNCQLVANSDQADGDHNGVGDACEGYFVPETDADGDGVDDLNDNCFGHNPDQADTDGDGIGNACDNCPAAANADQADANNDGEGDACEASIDGEDLCAEGNTTVEAQHVPANIYFLIDRSGSMRGDRWSQVQTALNTVAPAIAGEHNTGLGMYPERDACGIDQTLALGSNTAAELTGALSGSPDGNTPTAAALAQVRTSGLVGNDGRRAVVLLTDGAPNHCNNRNHNDMSDVEAEARLLVAAGIKVFVIGFQVSGADFVNHLREVAQIGDPSNPSADYFLAQDAEDLADAFESITELVTDCSFTLTEDPTTNPNYNRSRLLLEASGTTTELVDYTRNGTNIELGNNACSMLRSALGGDPSARVVFEAACVDTSICTPSPEVCGNQTDDNCDGFVDEGCDGDSPEVCGDGMGSDLGCPETPECVPAAETCDGTDNDCDGTIDEGCGGVDHAEVCIPQAELCNGIDDDCDGTIDDGCGCSPSPEVCGDETDNDCDGSVDENCMLPDQGPTVDPVVSDII